MSITPHAPEKGIPKPPLAKVKKKVKKLAKKTRKLAKKARKA
jgi:hypothetical protein